MYKSIPHRPPLVTTDPNTSPVITSPKQLLDQTGDNWDKAFRRFNDEPTPPNQAALVAASLAYRTAQQTYLLAVTVAQILPAELQ
jgi:hypothetical protein